MGFPSGEVAIVGAYESPLRRAPGVHPFAIHAECIRGALADAGLELGDVDGFATAASFPSRAAADGDVRGRRVPRAAPALVRLHRHRRRRVDLARRSRGASDRRRDGRRRGRQLRGGWRLRRAAVRATTAPRGGPGQWEAPYGPTTVATYALAAQRHMHEFGTTPEQLAQIAVQCRANAAANAHARFRDPLTVDDVLASPMIASRCTATTAASSPTPAARSCSPRAGEREPLSAKPVCLLGFGEALGQIQMNQMGRSRRPPPGAPARGRWPWPASPRRDRLRPALRQLHDHRADDARERSGSAPGARAARSSTRGEIAPGGSLPINTDGGGLSSNHPGRRGACTMIEGVRQLRGESPGVQPAGPRTCLVTAPADRFQPPQRWSWGYDHGSAGQAPTAAGRALRGVTGTPPRGPAADPALRRAAASTSSTRAATARTASPPSWSGSRRAAAASCTPSRLCTARPTPSSRVAALRVCDRRAGGGPADGLTDRRHPAGRGSRCDMPVRVVFPPARPDTPALLQLEPVDADAISRI